MRYCARPDDRDHYPVHNCIDGHLIVKIYNIECESDIMQCHLIKLFSAISIKSY